LPILVKLFFVLPNYFDEFAQKTLHPLRSLHKLLNLNLSLIKLLVSELALQKEKGLYRCQVENCTTNVVLLNESKLFFQILLRIQENVKLVAVKNVGA
jgi:hypothetical protein